MQGTMLYGPRDIRFEDRPEPTIIKPTDAILRLSATCICGSDLWPYRGIAEVAQATPMGHECVGTQESMMQAIRSARPGGFVSYVGVPHGAELDGTELFFAHVHLHGGTAPVRRYLPELIDLVLNEKINPGKVFDLTLPLDQVAEGYRAMDERRAIKALLRP
jgi:threonine dehydrogenase-like Zn-dependent dehydrogenase